MFWHFALQKPVTGMQRRRTCVRPGFVQAIEHDVLPHSRGLEVGVVDVPLRAAGVCWQMDLLSGIASLQSSGSRRVGAYLSCTANLQTDRLLDRWHALLAFTEVARSLFQLRTRKKWMRITPPWRRPTHRPHPHGPGSGRRRVMHIDLRTQLDLLQRCDRAP